MTSPDATPQARDPLFGSVLDTSARNITGNPTVTARPAQDQLGHLIWDAMTNPPGTVISQASTGTGKSLAYLTPAVLDAALTGRRSLIATESLSLQAQVVEKDAPAVVKAVTEHTGVHTSVALLKGWANYVCAKAARASAEKLVPGGHALSTADLAKKALLSSSDGSGSVIGWALGTINNPNHPGDKHSYQGKLDDQRWADVSVSTSECVGVDKCPFSDVCKPARARAAAAEAHVVVTNHTMLAVQAANNIPVVVGNKKLGPFAHIVVDEAHALPAQVRNQGAGELSGTSVRRLATSISKYLTPISPARASAIADSGEAVASRIDRASKQLADLHGKAGTVRLAPAQDPTITFYDSVDGWIDSATRIVSDIAGTGDDTQKMRGNRLLDRLTKMSSALDSMAEHRTGVARWVGVGANGDHVQQFSPVDVGPMLRNNLWEEDVENLETGETEKERLTVVAVSATLPKRFGMDIGVGETPQSVFESPFEEAFSNSAVFVPHVAKGSTDEFLLSATGARTPRLDVAHHARWAVWQIRQLVAANNGSALVLAATRREGEMYARELRVAAQGQWTVLDQWSGVPARQLVNTWRADTSSVLVGTRSLMTGVDAAGDTCSLVIIDRVPRAAGNPVDDARVESVMERLETSRWAADVHVYVSDAAVLLEQAAGRLIRSHNDSGMVAILDPRLSASPDSAFTYPGPSKRSYTSAYKHIPTTIGTIGEACGWLASRQVAAPIPVS